MYYPAEPGHICFSEAFWLTLIFFAAQAIVLLIILIRKQRHLNTLLKQTEQHAVLLDKIFENLPDQLYYMDRQARLLGVNPACYLHHGASSAKELIGKTDIEIQPAPLGRQLYEAEQRLMETGEVTRFREKHKQPDGSICHVESIKSPFKNNEGTVIGLVGITRDITEQVENEQKILQAQQAAEDANKAKSSFLAMMSHEIRTPMNGVIGAASLLENTPLTEFQAEMVRTIETCGENLMAVINDILDYSKIEAGKVDLENIPFSPRECIENSLDVFTYPAHQKNLELVLFIEPDVPKALSGDPVRLRQILVNLLGNALKFTKKGEIIVKTELLPIDEDNDHCHLKFSVRDTGIGISAETQTRLFKSFSQADASSTREYGGTGLGLVISRRLAELMGGTMWFESEKGKGSTFYFTIDLPLSSIPEKQTLTPPKNGLRGKHVLIVDDNETNLKILSSQLEHWGAIPTAFSHPEQVISHLKLNPLCDLALLDYRMPGMNGVDLANEICASPDTPCPPIILLSSSFDVIDTPPLIKARLSKPIRINDLHQEILTLLSEKTKVKQPDLKSDTPVIPEKTAKILIAEDNQDNQRVVLRMLQALHYKNVRVVNNGQEAVKAARETDYDIILMDVQMPVMNGLDASREIRKTTGNPETPWIIALTGGVMTEEQSLIREAGMNDLLPKPMKLSQLQEILDSAVGKLCNAESA